MVSSAGLIRVIGDRLRYYGAVNIVVDPVMVATSGARLIEELVIRQLREELLPIATVITPNIPEAEILAEMTIADSSAMETAAKKINRKYGCAVLLKGGHRVNDANDYLYDGVKGTWFYGKRIDNPNTHGTGCTLSSAIASNLAKGFSLEESVQRAKSYLSDALAAMLDLGKGSGPLKHNFALTGPYAETAEAEQGC